MLEKSVTKNCSFLSFLSVFYSAEFLATFLFSAFLVLLLTPRIANSQPMQKDQLSLHAGAAFPQGEFGATDQDDENSGFATTGLTVVGEYTYPIGTPGLGIVGSISVTANGKNENGLLGVVDVDDDVDDEVDVSSGYWINVPVMGGSDMRRKCPQRQTCMGSAKLE
jgi:hypothetical protein